MQTINRFVKPSDAGVDVFRFNYSMKFHSILVNCEACISVAKAVLDLIILFVPTPDDFFNLSIPKV